MTRPVLLGPKLDCHAGVHGALCLNPPTGWCYKPVDAEHMFLWPGRAGNPLDTAHLGELVRFHEDHGVVHSVRWPVVGCQRWVVDLDDFLCPVVCGRFGQSPTFQQVEQFAATRTAAFANTLSRRGLNMLTAYSHPSCRAILFRTDRERKRAVTLSRHLGSPAIADQIASKGVVVYPSSPAIDEQTVQRKWSSEPLRLVFCGRDVIKKGGDIALHIFQRLVQDYPDIQCTYIGSADNAPAGDRLEVLGYVPRAQVLDVLRRSHVLLHPANSESLGIIFLEAMSAAMAVVTGTGTGMEHIGELFESGRGAALVPHDGLSPTEKERRFDSAVRRLVEHRHEARTLALRNYREATIGRVSLENRDRTLRTIYDAASSHAAAPLRRADLPAPGGSTTIMASEDLKRAILQHTHDTGVSPYMVLSIDI